MPSDAERAVALLRYANYAKVAQALRVSRAAVADWAKGRSVTPYRLRQLEQLLRPDLQTKEAAPPEWAERLETKVDAIAAGQRVLADEAVMRLSGVLTGREAEMMQVMREALADVLAETSPSPQPGGEPPSGTGEADTAGEGPRPPRPSARPREK